jgi:DNA-directed RNA polymerase specialized sigma24 family protein
MAENRETSWSLIEAAAAGSEAARTSFTDRYLPVVRAYLRARWSGTPLDGEVDDAVQEVFLDCFRQGGVLERAEPGRGAGFRAYLFGVATKVALHVETRRARDRERLAAGSFHPDRLPDDGDSLSRVFDQEWARAVMREAADLQSRRARERGREALRRVELLHLRFQEGLPIRDIARLWSDDPARLHHEYAQARKEFMDALREVVGLGERCGPERIEEECAKLIELLN